MIKNIVKVGSGLFVGVVLGTSINYISQKGQINDQLKALHNESLKTISDFKSEKALASNLLIEKQELTSQLQNANTRIDELKEEIKKLENTNTSTSEANKEIEKANKEIEKANNEQLQIVKDIEAVRTDLNNKKNSDEWNINK